MAQQQANYFEGHLNWQWPSKLAMATGSWKLGSSFFDLTHICSSHLVSVTAGVIHVAGLSIWSVHRATASAIQLLN